MEDSEIRNKLKGFYLISFFNIACILVMDRGITEDFLLGKLIVYLVFKWLLLQGKEYPEF